MAIVTPNYENDLIVKIVAERAADFDLAGDNANIRPSKEEPVGGQVLDVDTRVAYVTDRVQVHSDGQTGEVDMQILHRFAPADERAAAVRMRALYDALHLCAEFTGASGVRYLTIRALSRPVFLEPAYYVLNVTLWQDG